MGYPVRRPARQMAQTSKDKVGPASMQGRIERFVSGPLNDGFAVVSISRKDGTRISLKGKNVLNAFKVGEMIKATGRNVMHPRFGIQMEVKEATYVDTGTSGLIRWLSEAGIEGVGPATATKIIGILGENAISLIVEGDERAKAVLGDKYTKIREVLVVRYGESKYGSMLASFEVGPGTRAKIYERYGDETGNVIAQNPYDLIHSVEGIAFATADQIARGAGLALDSEERIHAAAHDVLRVAENEGHSWVSEEDVIARAAAKTKLIVPFVAQKLAEANWEGAVPVTVEVDDQNVRGWAIARLSHKEAAIARAISVKLQLPKRMSEEEATKLVTIHSKRAGIELNELQTKAAIMALVEPLCIITGNPGTGKTTVLDIIVRVWKAKSRDIGLCSPTGKAAQRMFEKTKVRAKTMHRMLGADGKGFRRGKSNPIQHNTLAVDECSMMDIDLAFAFTNSWSNAQTLMLGDPFQLASVGAGRVFGDIIDSEAVPYVHLTEIRRQAKGSNIALGAEAIREGEVPEWGHDLTFIEAGNNEEIASKVIEMVRRERANGEDVQVLTPGHTTEAGTLNLNENLAVDAKGDNDNSITIYNGLEARVGDKIIQLDNDEGRKVFNGDSGKLVAIKGTMTNPIAVVEMDSGDGGVRMEYTQSQFKELTLSHALTIHKAQGSEYGVVIMPMTTSHWRLLRRTLLNTGVTRAKSRCYVVGQKKALMQAINNDDSNERQTQLKQLICAMVD